LQRNIVTEEFFKNSYIENSVQYNVVETDIKEGGIEVASSAFLHKMTPMSTGFEVGISSDRPILKFHFTLEGEYSFESLSTDGTPIHIPASYCNMYYLPILEGKDIFLNGKSKIFVAHDYLQYLLRSELKKPFVKLHSAISNLKPFLLWEKSRPISPLLISKVHEILQCPYKGHVRQRYLESKLTALLIDFLLGKHTVKVMESNIVIPDADYLSLVKVEAYIRKNLKKPLNIINLAELAGFNATKLKRDFKKVYGTTVYKYITGLRMEEAKKRIVEDHISVAQAAYEVGYSNPQHFTTAFKRTMGYLPSLLRQAMYSLCSLFLEIPYSLIGL
jgi:AraC-like DNA-binding protein